MDVPCVITEKVEGSNFHVTVDKDDNITVGQRNYSIEEVDSGEHMFWKVAREERLIEWAHEYKRQFNAQQVTLRGEFIGPGIQGNYYQLAHHKVLLFDVMIDGKYLDAPDLYRTDEEIIVPTLAYNETLRAWLNEVSITEASNGRSKLVDRIREGIVIKPMEEMNMHEFGRVIIKKRSPVYLLKEK
jgi:RNA ligase (TIGR02306 family)